MENAIFHFPLAGAPVSCEKYGFGHINRTFLVVTDQGKRYILQGINGNVFPDVRGMMENIAAVTRFVGERVKDPRGTLHIVPAEDGDIMYTDEKGQSWRVYDFVEDSICLQAAETREDFFQSAVAFGRFQDMLTRFPAHTLHETIPNFHNTPERYKTFRRVLAADVCGRAAAVRDEIEFALSREQTGGELQIDSRCEKDYPENHGTSVRAEFNKNHIDMTPLGDVISSIVTLIQGHPDTDFLFKHILPDKTVLLDTRELRAVLGDVPLNSYEVIKWIEEYLKEQYS